MYLFDELPLEVIHYVIFPYLDYSSRVIANTMLPPRDRISKKLNEDEIIRIENLLYLKKTIDELEGVLSSYTKTQRHCRILRFFRNLIKNSFKPMKYNMKLRNLFLEQSRRFLLPEEYEESSAYMKKTLPLLCQTIIDSIEQTPFLREVSLTQ